ncbi:MAG: hypothetical protein M3R54_13045, partial [Chloroflexota bacterium]|nr:hypothetical protein [Chloroflexota bacterium]
MWWVVAAVAGAVAAAAITRWAWAFVAGEPILYGEGAVAHAASLARAQLEYAKFDDPHGPLFVAANYPPLYFHVAGIAGPFIAGRTASVLAALFVAVAIARTAQLRGSLLAGVALGLCWLACVPVAVWGPVVKPDLLAVALAVAAVLAARDRRRSALAGALIALAVWTKPTEALPAIALAFFLAQERAALLRYGGGAFVASVTVVGLTWGNPAAMFTHVVTWNALPWHADRALLLVVLGLIVIATPLVLYASTRPRGAVWGYALAALGIVVLGGREGATLNYLLDLAAATMLGLATVADRLAARALPPLALAAQVGLAAILLDPFGFGVPGAISTGSWAPPGRLAVVHEIHGDVLAEDSGLLVADGREPRVDDLFLWSRLLSLLGPSAFPEGPRVLSAVRDGEFDAVVSEVDLARLSSAPTYERERWHPQLADAVLARYRLARQVGGLFVYERATTRAPA